MLRGVLGSRSVCRRLFSMSFRLCMSLRLGLFVVLGGTMGIAVSFAMTFVHAFMKHLGFLPGVLAAGSGGEDERGGGEGCEGGFFHEESRQGRGVVRC